MTTYLPKRAFAILREGGAIKFTKASTRFILRRLDPQWYWHFRFHTWKNHLQNRIKYDAPPDPYKAIKIRPNEIDHRVGLEDPLKRVKYRGIARTMDGDWDSKKYQVDVEDQWIIKGIIQRFEYNYDWEDTTYYKKLNEIKNSESGELRSYLKKRCNNAEELFVSIKSEGYKSGHVGDNSAPDVSQPVSSQLEVLVTIDRYGRINLFEGHHRFGIARVLGLEIPAHVVCRHKRWQEVRDQVHNNGLPESRESLRDHPDLQDVLKI